MTKNSTTWLAYIQTVLSTIGSGRYGQVNDRKTYNVIARALPDMFTPRGLDGGLKTNLLSNIEIRAMVRLEHDGPITLSRHQRAYARRMGWDQLPAFEELYATGQALAASADSVTSDAEIDAKTPAELSAETDELMNAFQQYFSIVSASFQHQFSTISAQMTPKLAETLMFWHSSNVKSCKVNHESHMTAAPQPDAHEWPFQVAIDERLSIPEVANEAISPIPPELMEEKTHGGEDAAPCRVVASFFHNNPDAPPSANLEVGADKYALVFSDVDRGEEGLRSVSSKPWLDWLEAEGLGVIRSESRAAGRSKARYRISPLYAANDRFARNAPVAADSVVVLAWADDEQPESVTLVSQQTIIPVPLAVFNGRHPKAPTHKGQVSL